MAEPWLWPLALGVLGLIFGSFIATVTIRWPAGRSTLVGRSECDSCGKTLGAEELVPIASFVMLRGKCAGCGAAIRPVHPVIEAIGMAIGIGAGLAAPGSEGAAGAVFGWLLLALGALDLTALWLPNLLTGVLGLVALIAGALGLGPTLDDRLIGGVAGFGVLWLVAMLYRALRGRDGLGGGDPKLFGAIGLWLGWERLPLVLLAACLIGLSAVLGFRMRGRKLAGTDRLPLGSMLAVAAWAVWLGVAVAPPPIPDGAMIYLVPTERR